MKAKDLKEMRVGDTFKTAARTVTETDIVLFAGLTGDYHPAHTDDEYAKKMSLFRKRVAHGFLVLSICNGLLVRSGVIDMEVKGLLLGINNVKFLKPVSIGDTIRVEYQLVEKRQSKTYPDMDIITLKGTCINQSDETVMTYEHIIMLER